MRVSVLQLSSGDDPQANLGVTTAMIDEAAAEGAQFILTPEVTNCVSLRRAHMVDVLRHEAEDETLGALRERAQHHGIWLLIGSLSLKTSDAQGRFANRSFLIGPDGTIAARYDKLHMFDVQVSPTETYRESSGYRPGEEAVLAETPFGAVGMTICYDLRFPHLYRQLALAGADIITVPSAFSPMTGVAHWEVLLRARAIETGSFVLAPAQTGTHSAAQGRSRQTYGHSLIIDPWGEVLADAGTECGIISVDLDLAKVAQSRRRIPAMTQIAEPKGP